MKFMKNHGSELNGKKVEQHWLIELSSNAAIDLVSKSIRFAFNISYSKFCVEICW